MLENAILLVPFACLIAALVIARRACAPAQSPNVKVGTIDLELRCDSQPALDALRALNGELGRAKLLMHEVESAAVGVGRAAQEVARVQRAAFAKAQPHFDSDFGGMHPTPPARPNPTKRDSGKLPKSKKTPPMLAVRTPKKKSL